MSAGDIEVKLCVKCNKKCKKIGETNRSGIEKVFCCLCYVKTQHRLQFNKDFKHEDYCNVCKFNELLEQAIEALPNGNRYCCIRKLAVPITMVREFDCTECSMFVMNDNEDSICDPI